MQGGWGLYQNYHSSEAGALGGWGSAVFCVSTTSELVPAKVERAVEKIVGGK